MHDALCLEARVHHNSSKTNQARALIAWINRAVASVAIICKHRDSSYGRILLVGFEYNTTGKRVLWLGWKSRGIPASISDRGSWALLAADLPLQEDQGGHKLEGCTFLTSTSTSKNHKWK